MAVRENVFCPKCQEEVRPFWIKKGPHVGVYCPCGKWLAWRVGNWAQKGYFGSDNQAASLDTWDMLQNGNSERRPI